MDTVAQHDVRKFEIKIDLAQERELFIEDGDSEFFIYNWPISIQEINSDEICLCEKPNCFRVDSTLDFGDSREGLKLANYETNKFNNALYSVFQKIIEKTPFSGSEFIALAFDFPATEWTFSPKNSLFEVARADEALRSFDNGDVVLMSAKANVQELNNFKGSHLAIFLGRNARDNRPILLSKIGGEIFAIDFKTLRRVFGDPVHLFRLRWKKLGTEIL